MTHGTGDTSDDILLHKLQQTEAGPRLAEEIKVYLYKDPHGRLTAEPEITRKMREGQIGYS